MESFLQDLRFGARMLIRARAMSAIAVLALALGIGANSAIFSVVYAVLLRPLPVRDGGSVAAVQSFNPRMNIPPISSSYATYGTWSNQVGAFEQMAAAWTGNGEFQVDQRAETVPWWRVTAGFFPVLGVQPAFGRPFSREDDSPGAGHVAVLSYDLWRRRFAADPGVCGKILRLNGETFTIVGVMPAGFHIDGKPADLYTPIARDPADRKGYLPVTVFARLRPGVKLAQAQAEMDAVVQRLDTRKGGWKAQVWSLRDLMAHDVRLSLWVLLGAVTLVLLIACANIASLLLARSGARQREVAIRASMGAGRGRLLRQFLTESLLLGLLGGTGGLLLAVGCMRLVPLLEDSRLPNMLLATRIDRGVLAFTILLSLGTGVIFGMAPALSAVPRELTEVLKEGGRAGGGRNRKRLWSTLVVCETALALVLTIGATLFVRSFFYLRDTAPGFRVDGLVTATVKPAPGQNALAYYRQALEKVRALPGVRSATLASTVPLDGDFVAMSLPLEGYQYDRPQDWPVLWVRTVEDGYFETLGVPLKRGRTFGAQDAPGGVRSAIVNETMARRFWPGQDAVGKHMGTGKDFTEIVGVAGDVRHQDATKDGLVEVFYSLRQAQPAAMTVVARASGNGNPMRLAPAIGRAVAELEGKTTPVKVRDVLSMASDRLSLKRLTMAVIASFAALALVLAAIGIYGVLSFTVAQRTHEIGVRIAVGAPRNSVVRMIVGQASALAAAGIVIGMAAAIGVSRVVSSLLYGVRPTDPGVYAAVAAVLLGVAATAAWIPARRAARVDPVTALRHE